MDQITYTKTYQEYKAELDRELSKTAEGFVKIGYLLKVARDTEILAASGYSTVTEFAKAEYGIDKTMVSRFISINDKFSEGGYSDQLQEQYKGYGYAKLTLMLSIPDEINQQLSPAYSKAEIQAIKDEVDEERSISDLEVMMEPTVIPQGTGKRLLEIIIRQLGEDSPDLYLQMARTMPLQGEDQIKAIKETMAPNGEKQYSIRISGMGRFLMSIRDTEDTITMTSLRTMEQHIFDYPALLAAWQEILPPSNGKPDTDWTKEQCIASWELEYDKEFPGKAKVAPVQPKKPQKTESKPVSRKEPKVQKAPKPKPAATAPAEAPEPEKPEETGMKAADRPIGEPEAAGQAPQENQPQESDPADAPAEEQMPGQVNIEEILEKTEEGAILYGESFTPPQEAEIEPDKELDEEWEKQKSALYEHLKQMNDKDWGISRNLSTLGTLTIKLFRKELINMAALIEKELLRREEEF